MTELTNSNPLSEVDPKSLDELFSRDPLFLTKDNITEIVKQLRAARTRWLTSGATSDDGKKAKKADKTANGEALKGISLDSLDLEI